VGITGRKPRIKGAIQQLFFLPNKEYSMSTHPKIKLTRRPVHEQPDEIDDVDELTEDTADVDEDETTDDAADVDEDETTDDADDVNEDEEHTADPPDTVTNEAINAILRAIIALGDELVELKAGNFDYTDEDRELLRPVARILNRIVDSD
jgi:hypothetical protein